jgi:hypothetical protein
LQFFHGEIIYSFARLTIGGLLTDGFGKKSFILPLCLGVAQFAAGFSLQYAARVMAWHYILTERFWKLDCHQIL